MSEFDYNLKPNKRSMSMRKPIFGIGVNDADYQVRQNINGKYVVCYFYRTWANMLSRCYDPKYHEKQPTYIGCSVCDEWHAFSNFREWMENQDYIGKQLDKDILVFGNRIYSPEACFFVSHEINNLLTNTAENRGAYPKGVCFLNSANKYIASIRIYGRKKHLGCFGIIEEAEEAYFEAKIQHVGEIAMQQTDRLKSALIDWVDRKISAID